MKSKRVWAALIFTVAVTSTVGLVSANGVTSSNAPHAVQQNSDGGEDIYIEPPHTVEVILPGSVTTLPDGTVVRIYNKDVTQLDGTVFHYSTKTTTHPDGRKEQEATTTVNYADGTKTVRTVHPDGTVTETSESSKKVAGGVLTKKTESNTGLDKTTVLKAVTTYTDAQGGKLITDTQKTSRADGSSETIETIKNGSGKQIRKQTEQIKADKTAVVTVDGSGLALTLKGSAANNVLKVAGGKTTPATTPKTIMINGRTWQVDGATGDGI